MPSWIGKLTPTTRLILISAALGVVGALGAQVFLWLLGLMERYFLVPVGHYDTIGVAAAHALTKAPAVFTHLHWWLPVATTLGGLAAGIIIYGVAPETEGHGTDAAINAFHLNNGRMRARVPFVKTLVSAITIGSGGSGGREGPTAQIASGAGAIIGQLLKLPDNERRLVVLAGMAAGLSAIFKSPLGTAIFAVEILYSGMAFEGAALIYTIVAAAVAYAITGLFSGFTPLFLLPADARVVPPLDLFWFAALGVIAGAVGALLPKVYYGVRDGFRAIRLPNWIKPAIGGLGVGLIGIVLPPVIGGGYGYIQRGRQRPDVPRPAGTGIAGRGQRSARARSRRNGCRDRRGDPGRSRDRPGWRDRAAGGRPVAGRRGSGRDPGVPGTRYPSQRTGASRGRCAIVRSLTRRPRSATDALVSSGSG